MSDSHALRVLVVDDHPAIRAGIASLIDAEQPRLQAVGSAATADEALACTRSLQPDVVILDVNLDGEDGLALIPALHGAAPCRVVVLSSLLDPHVAAYAARLGAHACLHKTAPAAELMSCILAAGRSADDAHVATAIPGGAAGAALRTFAARDDGVTAIEYGLLAALIVVTCIGAFSATGDSLIDMYDYWSAAVIAAL